MILYFSGTGNSLFVANKLAELLSERLFCMKQPCSELPDLQEDEPVGVVFPVYAWGLPRIVRDFLQQIRVGDRYVWTVMTCGDDMGYADEKLESELGCKLQAAFSVQMPNTYVCLPGFDVDSPEIAHAKLLEAKVALPLIAEKLMARQTVSLLTRGAMPWLKTYILGPLFNKFLVTDKYFKTRQDCSSCGLCAKQCPQHDIAMVSGRPQWQHASCTGCLRCYHHCPKRAIDWGRFTRTKGQKESLSSHI